MAMDWPGFREDGSLALPLDPQPLLLSGSPLRLRLDGQVLDRKHELHMTLLGRDAGDALRTRLGEEHIRTLFQSLAWQPRGTRSYALLRKVKQQWDGPLEAWSLIEHLQAPAFAEFRHLLAQASGFPLDCGVPHATLYVAGDLYGIGVSDIPAYQACFVREVAAPEVM